MSEAIEEAKYALPQNGAQWLVATLTAIALTLAGFTLSQVFDLNREQGGIEARVEALERQAESTRATLSLIQSDLGKMNGRVERILGLMEGGPGQPSSSPR